MVEFNLLASIIGNTFSERGAVKVEGGDFPAKDGKLHRQACAAGKYNPALTASPSDIMLLGRRQPALCALHHRHVVRQHLVRGAQSQTVLDVVV